VGCRVRVLRCAEPSSGPVCFIVADRGVLPFVFPFLKNLYLKAEEGEVGVVMRSVLNLLGLRA
jgi:hypothetical protein